MSDNPKPVDFDTAPPVQVAQYDNLITKFVPGYEVIFQLAAAHFSTVLPSPARMLVVGAGSGKELLVFGQARPDWSLTGVDPSGHMLSLARRKLEQAGIKATLHQGLVQDLPTTERFDAATCILVTHFLPDDGSKLALLKSIAERLPPGAPLILLDIYGGAQFVREFGPTWIAHGHGMGIPLEVITNLEKGHAQFFPVSEERSLELLAEAGFEKVRRFYSALIYCGWIATKTA